MHTASSALIVQAKVPMKYKRSRREAEEKQKRSRREAEAAVV